MKRQLILALLVAACIGVALPAPAAMTTRGSSPAVHGFGLRPPAHAVNQRAQRPRLVGTPPPAAVDLTPWTVPVGDQGRVHSCVTWAIDYAMLGWYSRREGHAGEPFAPMYAYAQIQAMHGWSDAGSDVEDAMQIAEQQGIDTRADYPQGNDDWQTQPTPSQHAAAAAHRTLGSAFLYQSWTQAPGESARYAIEASVAAGHPVALSIPVFAAFEQLSPASHLLTAADVSSSSTLGYHEVLVVGYDETGVRIQNSWGTSWGDRGFADLAWDFVDERSLDASVMTGFADAVAAPAIASVLPATGPLDGGTSVTIRGLGLAAADAVTFGATPASSYAIVDDTTIVASAPAATTAGPVQVHVSGPSGASTTAVTFTYQPPVVAVKTHQPGPTIRRVSRVSAHVVVILGSGLRSATTVRFGGRRVRILTTSNNAIRVRVPQRLSARVRVTTPFGTATVTAQARLRAGT